MSSMSPTKAPPSPKLYEPYEKYNYTDLRHEMIVRDIRLHRSVQRLNDEAGLIQLLRDWDQTQNVRTSRPIPRRASPRRPLDDKNSNSRRTIRTRRGCRFRLINVLLSPTFSRRWAEMISRGRKMEMNGFWVDVHVAYMANNSSFDKLHFQDALFVNVTPNVILAHSAARLLQMWVEIVYMYRNAVAQVEKASVMNDSVHSFFDFCAGRLDLLYLHMAMLLEPKLFKFITSDKLAAVSEPFTQSKIKAVASTAESAQNLASGKPGALFKSQAPTPVSSKPATTAGAATSSERGASVEAEVATVTSSKPNAIIETATAVCNTQTPIIEAEAETIACSKLGALTKIQAATTAIIQSDEKIGAEVATITSSKPDADIQTTLAANSRPVAVTHEAPRKAKEAPLTAAPPKLSGVLTQNPEMKEFPVSIDTAVEKPNVSDGIKSSIKAKQSKPAASLHKISVSKKIKKSVGNGKAATTAASTKVAKPKSLLARQKESKVSAKLKAVSTSSRKASLIGNSPAQKTSCGKRPREEETAIVKIPTVCDIVPHSGKRVHTRTTLATRTADVVLPPDEWDILESRLRKVNDNIDRCHQGLSSMEGSVSESYKQSLEADLRFYSAIKQRLQEQLLVVMQSGY